MKLYLKVILILFMFFCFEKISAYELTYSEWSSDYPNGVHESLIQREDRYLWYKETETNIEYLVKEEIGDKLVDYNNYIFTEESPISNEKPQELEDRIIKEKTNNIVYKESDVFSIKINNINFIDKVLISEIEVINKKNNQKINYLTDNVLLNDGDYNNYFENSSDITVRFDSLKDINDILIKLYYKCDCNNDNSFDLNVLSEDDYNIFSNSFIVKNCVMEIDKTLLKENLTKTVNEYTYIDKKYKTYNVDRVYTIEYYKEYNNEEYKRLDSSKTTFYRYVTNEYLLYTADGVLVDDPNYCMKNLCYRVYNKKQEQPKEESNEEIVYINPKTNDNIDKYFVLLIISFVLIVISAIYINILKKINNKSSFVESV